MAKLSRPTHRNTFVSDQPAEKDHLDFAHYVNGLVDTVAAPGIQTPLILGISGPWGSGKTSLMQLMELEVLRRTQAQDSPLKCLWINVWQVSQQGEGGQALLQALFTQMRRRLGGLSRLSFNLYLLRDRVAYKELLRQLIVNSYRILIVAAPLLLALFADAGRLSSAGVGDARVAGGLSLLLGLWLLVKPTVEAAREKISLDLGAVLDEAPYETKVSSLQKLQTHFERLVREWVGEGGRVIVFIDDLDRCSPDRIASSLEALKLFATTKGCVYVLGLDQEVVTRSIQARYKGEGGEDAPPFEGARYLEKIVQLPFVLPQIEVTNIEGYVKSFNADWPHEGCADIFTRGLPPNPRQIKRAINVFFLLWNLAVRRQDKLGDTVSHLRLAKVVALQTAYPDLFEWFKRSPYMLQEVETYFRRGPVEQEAMVQDFDEAERERFLSATARPELKNLFELWNDNDAACFGKLNETDLESFFSLTRRSSAPAPAVVPPTVSAAAEVPAGEGQPAADAASTGQGPPADPTRGDKPAASAGEPAAPSRTIRLLHQLPPPPRDFTGREEVLRELVEQINKGVVICGLQGSGGVGKTALALKLAEQIAPSYPDAQLLIDLKGTSKKPLAVAEALSHVVRSFYATAKLPDDENELRALYLSVLEGRRALLLLEDAADAAQVEPLIPPAGSLMLITSRQRFALPGLYARDLDTLPPADARALLLSIAPRVGEYADEIAQLCGYLPLALRAAASALAERRDISPADYARRLSDTQQRLKLLDKVELSLSLSYDLLTPELQKLWRALAVFPDTFDAAAAAAVWGADQDRARDLLGELIKYDLVGWDDTAARYALPSLPRLFADNRLTEEERVAAQARHAQHYLGVLEEADRLYLQGDEGLLNALALFDSEWKNIQAGQAWAAQRAAADEEAARLCSRYPYAGAYLLDLRLPPRERVRWFEQALAAAKSANDLPAVAVHLNNLGFALTDLGELEAAVKLYEDQLSIVRQLGDRSGEANALNNLGLALTYMGEQERSISLFEQSLAISRELGNRRGESGVLGNLGLTYAQMGDQGRAVEFLEQQLEIVREIGDRRGVSNALGNLGTAHRRLGESRRAAEFYEQALSISNEIGDRRGAAINLWNMSLTVDELGDRKQAVAHAEAALKILQELEDPGANTVRKRLEEWRGQPE
jgi:hypothetical protein